MTINTDLLSELVDRVRPAVSRNSHGNTEFDYGPAAERTEIRAWVQQDSRDEPFPDGRNPAEQRWLLITDEADLTEDDRIEWANHPTGLIVFEVHGPPEPTYRPGPGFHHTEATLRILDG